MKRRDFLKLIGVTTVAPSVLAGKAAPVGLTLNTMQRQRAVFERLYPEQTGEILIPTSTPTGANGPYPAWAECRPGIFEVIKRPNILWEALKENQKLTLDNP